MTLQTIKARLQTQSNKADSRFSRAKLLKGALVLLLVGWAVRDDPEPFQEGSTDTPPEPVAPLP
jgi:hypothetical protein